MARVRNTRIEKGDGYRQSVMQRANLHSEGLVVVVELSI